MSEQVGGFFTRMNDASVNFEPIYPHQIDHLTETIRTRFLGVSPKYQTISLYDPDWRLILTALRDLKERLP